MDTTFINSPRREHSSIDLTKKKNIQLMAIDAFHSKNEIIEECCNLMINIVNVLFFCFHQNHIEKKNGT